MTAHATLNTAQTAPVVVLHSSVSAFDPWAALHSALEDRFDVLAFDLSRRDFAGGDDSGVTSVALALIARIDRLATPVHLVGHSFGGAVALRIALLRPGLIKSLTLFEPAAFHILAYGTAADRQILIDLRQARHALHTAMSAGRADLGIKSLVDLWNGPQGWEDMPDDLCAALVSDAETIRKDLDRVMGETWRPQALGNQEIPTLVLVGMDSPDLVVRTAALVASQFRKSEFALLPELGHMAPVTAPDWVNPRIYQHISRVERSAEHFSWPKASAA